MTITGYITFPFLSLLMSSLFTLWARSAPAHITGTFLKPLFVVVWTSKVLLKKTKPKLLYLIDPWYQYEAQWEWATGDKSTINALRNILRKFKKDIESGLVKLYVDSDIDILKRFQSNSLDWAYIDSSHEYEHTSIELGLLCQKIKKGGVITGDDWYPDPHHKHHGVYKAVQEFIDSGKIKLIYSGEKDRQWVTKNLCD